MGEVIISCEKLRWLIAHGERCLAREGRPVAAMLAFTKKAYVDYKPLGVIGVIVPWNYPFHNVLSAVAAALMAGNGVIVKVTLHTAGHPMSCFACFCFFQAHHFGPLPTLPTWNASAQASAGRCCRRIPLPAASRARSGQFTRMSFNECRALGGKSYFTEHFGHGIFHVLMHSHRPITLAAAHVSEKAICATMPYVHSLCLHVSPRTDGSHLVVVAAGGLSPIRSSTSIHSTISPIALTT